MIQLAAGASVVMLMRPGHRGVFLSNPVLLWCTEMPFLFFLRPLLPFLPLFLVPLVLQGFILCMRFG